MISFKLSTCIPLAMSWMQLPLPGISEDRLWLLPLLATHAAFSPCRIAWFTDVVLPSIRLCDEAAAVAYAAKLERNARVHVARASQLWRLLPVVLHSPTDISAGAFDANLGRLLSSLLANSARPDLAELVGKGLSSLIAGLRAAAGLVPVSLEQHRALNDGEDGDGARSVAGEGGNNGATVFGVGGVSVYGGSISATDPRHHWIIQAMKTPPMSSLTSSSEHGGEERAAATRADAVASLSVISSLARNYLPVLFNAYEVRRSPPPIHTPNCSCIYYRLSTSCVAHLAADCRNCFKSSYQATDKCIWLFCGTSTAHYWSISA